MKLITIKQEFFFLILFPILCGCQDPIGNSTRDLPIASDLVKSESTETPEWVDRLPVSLNGKRPMPHPLCQIQKTTVATEFLDKFWHDGQVDYFASDQFPISRYFDEPQAKLCKAIFQRDIDEMKRLISAGVDINQSKRPDCTLLFIALNIADDPRPFELLMRSGADPNLFSNPSKHSQPPVSFCIARSSYNRLFRFVFENGGDPNLVVNWDMDPDVFVTPFSRTAVSESIDCVERVRFLIDKGGKVDETGVVKGSELVLSVLRHLGTFRTSPCSESACEKALLLLEAGASYRGGQIAKENDAFYGFHLRPIHLLAFYDDEVRQRPESEQKQFEKLLMWLIEQGESFEQAKLDLQKWEAERLAKGKPTMKELEQENRDAQFRLLHDLPDDSKKQNP